MKTKYSFRAMPGGVTSVSSFLFLTFLFALALAPNASAQTTFTNVPIAGLPQVYDSSVAWGDYDNDGRLDFLITGMTNALAAAGISQLWRNTSNGFTNVPIAGLPGVGFSSVAWGDYENDGRLDFLLTGISPGRGDISQLWRNTGDGFTNVTTSSFYRFNLPGVEGSSVAWGDYDNDGRLDFLLTGAHSGNAVAYIFQLWRNTGNEFAIAPDTAFPDGTPPGVVGGCVAWGDYDNDGRPDFLLTGRSGSGYIFQLWRNTGSGFTNVTAAAFPDGAPPGVVGGSVAWGDYNNDGRLDFLITGYTGSNYISQLWRNTGSGFINVTATAFPNGAPPGVYNGSVAWGDYDNDGRLDFLLTGDYYDGSSYHYISQLWQNTGSGFTNVPIAGLPGVGSSSVAWGDYDNDGRLDFLITGTTNGLASGAISQLWRNITPVTNAPPSAPTGLAMTATTNAVMLSWNSAVDDHTPASGLTYNVRAGTTPGGIDLLAAQVNAANGFRRVPAMGNAYLRHSLPLTGVTNGETVYWSVQAVDTSFAGGPFATETSVVSIPQLTITPNGKTNAIVSWTPPTWGWHLEETSALNPATWSASPGGELNPVSVSTTNQGVTFYRLVDQ